MKNKAKPPVIAEKILNRLSYYEKSFNSSADFRENYLRILKEKGEIKAQFWYWMQVLLTLPCYLKLNLYWSSAMFKNYFKTTVRHLMRNKFYSFINIFGLAFGMAITILIALYVRYELSFDTYHKNADRIYRVAYTNAQQHKFAVTHVPLAPALKKEFPEVVSAARIMKIFYCTVYYNQ